MSQDKLTRIAIVSADKCKPKRCRQECRKSCPVVRMGNNISDMIVCFDNTGQHKEDSCFNNNNFLLVCTCLSGIFNMKEELWKCTYESEKRNRTKPV